MQIENWPFKKYSSNVLHLYNPGAGTIHFRQCRMRETHTKVVHSSVSRCGSRIIDEISMHLTHSCVATARIWTRDALRFGKPDSERFRDHSFIAHHERFHHLRDRLAFTTFGAEKSGKVIPTGSSAKDFILQHWTTVSQICK